jgi:hypothetical protein
LFSFAIGILLLGHAAIFGFRLRSLWIRLGKRRTIWYCVDIVSNRVLPPDLTEDERVIAYQEKLIAIISSGGLTVTVLGVYFLTRRLVA